MIWKRVAFVSDIDNGRVQTDSDIIIYMVKGRIVYLIVNNILPIQGIRDEGCARPAEIT